jgi:hypothetical protein
MEFQSKRPNGRWRRWPPALAALAALLVAFTACGCGSDATTAPKRADGDRACQGLTPIEAAHRYKKAARQAGASRRFVELVTEPTHAVESSPGYPRLVGAFYASTLPPKKRAAAAAACAKELAAR